MKKATIIILFITVFTVSGMAIRLQSGSNKQKLNKRLINGIQYSIYSEVKKSLQKGADPNVKIIDRYKNGHSALMLASKKGNIAIVRILIKHGAKVNYISRYGTTALMLAAKSGRYQSVSLLLKRGARVNIHEKIANLDTSSALLKACAAGYLNIVQLLVRYRANVHRKNKSGYNALHVAAMKGQTHIVRFLLSRRINVNVKSGYYSKTALIFAAQDNHTDIVGLLLRHRANKYMFDYNGHTAFHVAAANGNIETMKILLRYRFNINTQIFQKSGEGPPDKDTALICAVRQNQFQAVKYLVSRGANIFIKNNAGRHALEVARISYKYAKQNEKEITKKIYLYLKRVARR